MSRRLTPDEAVNLADLEDWNTHQPKKRVPITHCKRRHLLGLDGARIDAKGRRHCRACDRLRMRKSRAARSRSRRCLVCDGSVGDGGYKYCSDECRSEHNKVRVASYRPKAQPGKCLYCGKEGGRRHQKYCDSECRRKAYISASHANSISPLGVLVLCAGVDCQNTFILDHHSRKYCDDCRWKGPERKRARNSGREFSGINRTQWQALVKGGWKMQGEKCARCGCAVHGQPHGDHWHGHIGCGGKYGCEECLRGVTCPECNKGNISSVDKGFPPDDLSIAYFNKWFDRSPEMKVQYFAEHENRRKEWIDSWD